MRLPWVFLIVAGVLVLVVLGACSRNTQEIGEIAQATIIPKLIPRSLQDAYKQLYDPENYVTFSSDDTPYADHFINPDGTFKPGREPQVTLVYVRSLMDNSETAVRQYLYRGDGGVVPYSASSSSPLPDHPQVLAIQREFGDFYVGSVYIPELGYIGDVWVPGNSLPYDPSGNAGGVVLGFHP